MKNVFNSLVEVSFLENINRLAPSPTFPAVTEVPEINKQNKYCAVRILRVGWSLFTRDMFL